MYGSVAFGGFRRCRTTVAGSAAALLAVLCLSLAPSALAAEQKPGSAAPAGKGLTVEQDGVFGVQATSGAAAGRLQVVAWVDHADNSYAVGEKVRLFVQANKDAFVTVLNVAPSGATTLLFPNAFQRDNRVKAGRAVEIPSAGSGASIRVTGPSLGRELIKVIASTSPAPLFPSAAPAGSSPFAVLAGKGLTVARDLQVTMDAQKAQEWDDYNKVITTMAQRPAPATALLPAPAGTAWPVPASGLRIATGKSHYRLGEPVSVYVTSATPCYLTLVNIGTSGAVRVLVPNAVQPRNLLPAGGTVVFPVPASGLRLTPMGPAGIETVTAVCSSDNRPVMPAQLAYDSSGFAAAGADRSAMARDLAVVAATPARRAATATVGFLVTQ